MIDRKKRNSIAIAYIEDDQTKWDESKKNKSAIDSSSMCAICWGAFTAGETVCFSFNPK